MGPQEVVGWYRDATVYRTEKHEKLHGRWRRFFAKTRATNACLLKPDFRERTSNKMIGLGRADISYSYDESGEPRDLPGLEGLLHLVRTTRRNRFAQLCARCYAIPRKPR